MTLFRPSDSWHDPFQALLQGRPKQVGNTAQSGHQLNQRAQIVEQEIQRPGSKTELPQPTGSRLGSRRRIDGRGERLHSGEGRSRS